MSIEWRGDLLGNLQEILAKSQRLHDDGAVGARIILAGSSQGGAMTLSAGFSGRSPVL